jgi:branched-chain amino acid transport system ATP-binding protein
LRRINQEAGITLVVIEHVMKAIMALCDRIVVLDFGKKISEGTPEEVCADPRVVEAYLGRVEEVRA